MNDMFAPTPYCVGKLLDKVSNDYSDNPIVCALIDYSENRTKANRGRLSSAILNHKFHLSSFLITLPEYIRRGYDWIDYDLRDEFYSFRSVINEVLTLHLISGRVGLGVGPIRKAIASVKFDLIRKPEFAVRMLSDLNPYPYIFNDIEKSLSSTPGNGKYPLIITCPTWEEPIIAYTTYKSYAKADLKVLDWYHLLRSFVLSEGETKYWAWKQLVKFSLSRYEYELAPQLVKTPRSETRTYKLFLTRLNPSVPTDYVVNILWNRSISPSP